MITVTDLFCGAGGSSWGAEQVANVRVDMAANHWATAIEVHQAHFPDTRHDLADISQADPRRYPATDILIASPECTNHSQAKGVSRKRQQADLFGENHDPSAERSRATMWDVGRFAEQLHYSAIIVENVWEATKWTGWHHWLGWLTDLGYKHKIVSANSMHFGVPQSRDRIYVVFWRYGLKPDLEQEVTGYCAYCEAWRPSRQAWSPGKTVGRYRQGWRWACTTCGREPAVHTEPAAAIIDWALPCPKIGERSRPLAAATRNRILAGLRRYGYAPITTAGAGHVWENTPGMRARSLAEPLPLQLTTATTALATPAGFLVHTAHGDKGTARRPVALTEPYPTVAASDDRMSLVVPLRRNGHARSAGEPVPTVTAAGNHHGLLMRNCSSRSDGSEMVTPIDEPARTMTTKGHQSLLVPYNRTGVARSTDSPAPTITTKDRCALVDPDRYVDECGFRMLEPHEIAGAMAFPAGYIPRTLTKKDQVKLAGNAVTPPVMTWLVGRVAQALEAAS